MNRLRRLPVDWENDPQVRDALLARAVLSSLVWGVLVVAIGVGLWRSGDGPAGVEHARAAPTAVDPAVAAPPAREEASSMPAMAAAAGASMAAAEHRTLIESRRVGFRESRSHPATARPAH